MSVLIHACCAPCLIYPARILAEQGFDLSVYFHNPNIHPYREFRARLDCIQEFCETNHLSLTADPDYGLREFLRAVVFKEDRRCPICYRLRVDRTAAKAIELGADSFSTTLLYSRYQNHRLLIELCNQAAARSGVGFYYHDFREGWQAGIDSSIAAGLYRQSYCGCIYSEQERYDNRLKKRLRKQRKDHVQLYRSGHDQQQ